VEVASLAVVNGLDPADDPVAPEDRQDVVAVLPLRGRDIHLQSVPKAPERLRPGAVVDEPVKGGEEGDAPRRHRAVGRVGMREQPASLQPDAKCAKALLRELPPGHRPGNALHLRVPALRELPHALPLPPADDGDLATVVEEHQHQRHLALAPPPVRLAAGGRVVLDLP
jgi:hypothetical protein